MSIVIAMLGEKLRELARKGQASVAGISAYLNEVGFSNQFCASEYWQ